MTAYGENGALVLRGYGAERGLSLDHLFNAPIRRWRGECEGIAGEMRAASV